MKQAKTTTTASRKKNAAAAKRKTAFTTYILISQQAGINSRLEEAKFSKLSLLNRQ